MYIHSDALVWRSVINLWCFGGVASLSRTQTNQAEEERRKDRERERERERESYLSIPPPPAREEETRGNREAPPLGGDSDAVADQRRRLQALRFGGGRLCPTPAPSLCLGLQYVFVYFSFSCSFTVA